MKSSEDSPRKKKLLKKELEARKIKGTKQNAPRNNPTTPFEGKEEEHTNQRD